MIVSLPIALAQVVIDSELTKDEPVNRLSLTVKIIFGTIEMFVGIGLIVAFGYFVRGLIGMVYYAAVARVEKRLQEQHVELKEVKPEEDEKEVDTE